MARRPDTDLLQSCQDLLSDVVGVPLICLSSESSDEASSHLRSSRWRELHRSSQLTHWSLNPAFFRLLESHDDLWRSFLVSLLEARRLVEGSGTRDNWVPVVFPGILDCHFFALPATVLETATSRGSEKRRRKLAAIVYGGPLGQIKHEAWTTPRKYLERICSAAAPATVERTLQYQLTTELLEVPVFESVRDLQETSSEALETLRLSFNGVFRDLMVRSDTLALDPAIAVYELYRLLDQRERIIAGLQVLVRGVWGGLSGVVLIRNALSGSGLVVAVTRDADGIGFKMQLAFVPDQKDVENFLGARAFDPQMSSHTSFLALPCKATSFVRVDMPHAPAKAQAAVWIGARARPVCAISLRRLRRTNLAFLDAWLPPLVGKTTRIRWRVLQASQQSRHNVRHEISDLTLRYDYSSPVQIREILETAGTLIPFMVAGYFRPRLAVDRPDVDGHAELHSSWPATEPQEDFVLTPEVRRALFDEMVPHIHMAEKAVLVPVVAGSRTVGILRFQFGDLAQAETSMHAMMELGTHLASRVLHRRLLEVLGEVMGQTGYVPGTDWANAAEKIAFLLSEDACSIWMLNRSEHKVTPLARAGLLLPQGDLSAELASRSLVTRWLSHKALDPIVVNLEDEDQRDKLIWGKELHEQGFRSGIVTGTVIEPEGVALVLMLWTKTAFSHRHFSAEDKRILQFITQTLTQILHVQQLLKALREQQDSLLPSLAHELRGPMGAVYDGLAVLRHVSHGGSIHQSERLIGDMQNLVLYARRGVDEILGFAEREGILVGRATKADAPDRPVRVFEQLVQPMEAVFDFFLRPRGLTFANRFDPQTFPGALRLTARGEQSVTGILFNLLDNAVKYSSPGAEIVVSGTLTKESVVIRVINTGIGVPAGEEELVFEKYRRGSNSSQSSVIGNGLGLYISRKAAESLGGSLVLERRNEPTVFAVSLPVRLAVFGRR